MEFWRTTRWRPLSLWLLFLLVQLHLCTSTLVEDYEQCRDHQQFSRPNGSLVCDPEGRLQPKAVAQLHGMLRDLEKNVPCDCVDGCARGTDHGSDKFMALLLVSSSERVEQSGGIEQLNDTAQHIWDDAGMGSEQCDNGMLLIYLRDQRKMATYQGHQRFKLFSDQEIANLHELAMNGGLTNGTANVSALPLGDFGSAGAGDEATVAPDAEVRRADDSWAPVVGLSIALALTFLVLIILLALLLAKCCRLCCPKPARKASKYYVNPMPSYKSIEPIYIVTPAGSEAAAFAAPPSATSLYGTYGHRPPPPPPMMPHHHHHHPGMYGGPHPPPPPMGPLVHLPRSRSTTPTSTQRIHRTYHPSGGTKTMHSMHSTPEAHKRDKIKPHRGSSTLAGTYHTAPGHGQHPHHPHHHNSSPESASADGRQSPKKKLSQPPPTIHEAELPDRYHHQQGQQQQMMVPQHPQQQQQQQQQPLPPPHHQQQPQPAQPQLPFLDPWRKQEVQTREEFIG